MSADGGRKQKYMHDFFNYAGLARSVWLYCVPQSHVKDIKVRTDVEGRDGVVKYDVVVEGEAAAAAPAEMEVRVVIRSETGDVVGQATGSSSTVRISEVQLWQPRAAYLYTLEATLVSTSTKERIDYYTLPFGVRTVKVQGSQFLINDKPFYFTGYGKHEDTPVRGKGHDPAYMVHDFELMKWTGANSFRTAHYPYSEEVMEFADRYGIVVIDETAAVGLNLGIAGGLFGGQAPATFSEETMNDKTRKAHEQAVRELIARDKNYACVVMWSIANEPASHEEGAREYFAPLVKLARELDETRPVCFTNFVLATVEKDRISDLFDVLCLNRYYGWYEHTGDLETAEVELERDLRSWQDKYRKPMVMAEYGADTLAGMHVSHASPWSEEFQVDMLEMYHRVFDRIECIVGEQVWTFADFQTTSMVFRVDGNKKGIFTRDRRPKMAARVLKKRWLEDRKGW